LISASFSFIIAIYSIFSIVRINFGLGSHKKSPRRRFFGKMKYTPRNKKIAIIAGIILAIITIAIFAFQFQFSAPQKTAEEERIVINLTTTEAELIPKLKEQGYIKSEWAFNFVLERKGWQGKIEPGGYNVSKGMSAWQLADTLVNHPYQKWLVVPEGLRVTEIAEKLQETLGWTDTTKAEFLLNSKEGYLFPDTYLLNLDYTGGDVAKRMESQFNEKTMDLFKEAKEKNIRNDTLIALASLVQREAANEEEMPLIAGVIWNRWLKDMKFEIDATIQYALGEPGNWWPIINPDDYKLDSPYNTYLHKGRPPAPICNPGLAAIDAVINSEESEYLYYLHDSEGQIHLAKTYEEHQANIEQYLLESTTGTITDIALSAKVITIRNQEEKEIGVAITEKTTLLDKDGKEIELKDFQLGENITAAGRWTGEDTFISSIIRKK